MENLTGEALRLYEESTPEIQERFRKLKANREKARELADMVGNIVVDENLPTEVIGLTADCLHEDFKQIIQAAEEIEIEDQAIREMQQAAGKEGQRDK